MEQNKFNYKYCVVRDNKVWVSDEPIIISPLTETALLNVTVKIDDNGVMIINGDERRYNCVLNSTKVDELDEKPMEKYIKHYKGIKFFKWYIVKPYDYVKYCFAYENTKPKKIILSKFNLEII